MTFLSLLHLNLFFELVCLMGFGWTIFTLAGWLSERTGFLTDVRGGWALQYDVQMLESNSVEERTYQRNEKCPPTIQKGLIKKNRQLAQIQSFCRNICSI